MIAVIPAAGIGKRLRPHTLNKPKALLPVAGKPILGHIVDDLRAAGVDRFVVIVGYMQEVVRHWFASDRPECDVTFVQQTERLGLGHAIWFVRNEVGDEPFFCILGDTILKADYSQLLNAEQNVIAVQEVDDPRRFGVVELQGEQVVRFVEKPDTPPSNLAIVGAYLFRDSMFLWQALDRIVTEDIRTKGEYQLTDALQIMVTEGCRFRTMMVNDWYDCGKSETWLLTNRVLLDQAQGAAADASVRPPCAVGLGVTMEGTTIGPYVSIGPGTRLDHCELTDCVVGANSHLSHCRLQNSLVGDHCTLVAVRGEVNVGDYSELRAEDG